MKRILVTGGNGFLGGWVIRTLLQENYIVTATVRTTEKGEQLKNVLHSAGINTDNLFCTIADLKSEDSWDKAMTDVSYVIHVATPMGGDDGDMDSPQMIDIARVGVDHVLSAAIRSGIKRIVMTSSGAANYPSENLPGIIDESVWSDPDNKILMRANSHMSFTFIRSNGVCKRNCKKASRMAFLVFTIRKSMMSLRYTTVFVFCCLYY